MCRLHPSLQCFLDVHDFRQVSRQICFAGFRFVYPSNDISVCSSCFQHKSTHTEGIVVGNQLFVMACSLSKNLKHSAEQ